jgi:hypothetical protein
MEPRPDFVGTVLSFRPLRRQIFAATKKTKPLAFAKDFIYSSGRLDSKIFYKQLNISYIYVQLLGLMPPADYLKQTELKEDCDGVS